MNRNRRLLSHCDFAARRLSRLLTKRTPAGIRNDAETTNVPLTFDQLFARLDELGIVHTTKEHPAVFTVSESQSLRDEIPGGHTKNLFLKDKKGQFFLVTVEENAEINLKGIHWLIGVSGRVSFGKSEPLMELLGVIPGSVTAFGAINDSKGQVTVVLDEALMQNDIITRIRCATMPPPRSAATIWFGFWNRPATRR